MKTIATELTVIIPVRNRAEMIVRTVESVVSQSVLPGRLILVDNGSTDRTPAVLEELKARHDGEMEVMVMSEPQPGATRARNTGLGAVESEWTMFFDSDDEMLAGHIERAMAKAAAEPDAEIVGWDMLMVAPGRRSRVRHFYTRRREWHCLIDASLATLRYMARTELFRRAGGWSADVQIWNDIELGLRLLALKPVMARCEGKPTVKVNVGAESITGPSYASRADRYENSLKAMEATLGPGRKSWIELKRVILAGQMAAEGAADVAAGVMNGVLAREEKWHRRAMWRGIHAFYASGLGGLTRVLKYFF